jgi:ketosteroid isomerase-like protein
VKSRPGFRKVSLIFGLLLFWAGNPTTAAESELQGISIALDAYHGAAAEGDWDTYFSLMSEDSVFLGTDVNERWTKEEFRGYAEGRSGWAYRAVDRNINLTPDGRSTWFDEILESESYGTSRGTGVLIKTDQGWKISQYHLTFPIPNALSREFTDAIKAYEARQ